jgi:hypothetical protein
VRPVQRVRRERDSLADRDERAVPTTCIWSSLLVHVLDPVVADVYIQLKGLKQGHHRRTVIIARPGGGVGETIRP